MLQVRDVAAASAWYQSSLGLRSGHGGDEFEMLFDGDDFVLQLHRLDADEHGRAFSVAADMTVGAGVSLWFETADKHAFDVLVERARGTGATIVEQPHWNPVAHHHEATFADADGYVVVLCGPFEMADPS